MYGMISVRKKKHSEQMMKVHMVKYYSISNSFKYDWWEKEKQFGGKRPKKNHDTNYHNKPVIGVISVRKKKQSEQMMKVHMVKYYSIINS